MKNKFILMGLFLILICNKSIAQQIDQKSYTFMIYFDIKWKVIKIVCKDENNQIFPKRNEDGSIVNNEYAQGFRFCYFNEDLLCKSAYVRFVALTNEEALNYQKYHKTTLSVRSSIRDYYLISEQVPNSETKKFNCKLSDVDFKYHALFNPDKNGLPLQSYMQKGSFMAITDSGKDSIVIEGYTAFLEKDGSPEYDCYLRHRDDFKFLSYCNTNYAGVQDDIYEFKFFYKGNEYFRVVSGNLHKALFFTDPYDKQSSMAVVVRDDGSADYIVGEFDDLYERYRNQTLPRIETNTTAFVKKMLSKYPNLILWSIIKPTRDLYKDVVRIGDLSNDIGYFSKLLAQGYLRNQSLWGTLLYTGGINDENRTWKDQNSTHLDAEVFF